jgi:hypothetical protein
VTGSDLEAIAHAFPGLETLDLPDCDVSLRSGCAAALPTLLSLRAACGKAPPGLLAGGWLKRAAPALEVLQLVDAVDWEGDGTGSWQGHPALRELELTSVPYYLSSAPTCYYDEFDLCCEGSSDDEFYLRCGGVAQYPFARGRAPPRRTTLTDLGPPVARLPALRSLRIGLTCGATPRRADLAAGPAALRGWAAAWTHLRALHLRGGEWFDIGGTLPVLAERLGPHLAHLSLDPCAFIAGASDFGSLPDCLRACMPKFVALEELDLKLCEGAGVLDSDVSDPWSSHTPLALTPALLTGLVAPLAGALRPPRLRNARLRLPSFEAATSSGGPCGHAAGPWAEALVRELTQPGLHIELYACSGQWADEPDPSV